MPQCPEAAHNVLLYLTLWWTKNAYTLVPRGGPRLVYFKMLVHTKTCVVAPSFLFTVEIATGVIVMLLMLPGWLPAFLAFTYALNMVCMKAIHLLPPTFL